VVLLVVFILPRLTKVFSQSGIQLPLTTKILVAVSHVISFSPILDILVFIFLFWFFVFFRKTLIGRKLFEKVIFHIPIVKELVKKVVLVRFARALSGLIGSGLSIIEALKLSADAVGNYTYQKIILTAVEEIQSGAPLSKILQKYPNFFPRFLTGLMTMGERTGTLEYVLKTFADFYDDEVDNLLKDLTTFIEPLLLLILGFIIGVIAISILLPIYQLVGKFV